MKALISPSEQRAAGYRVVEVRDAAFEVADPLFWVDCAADLDAGQSWFDPVAQSILPVPAPQPSEADIIKAFTDAIQRRLDDFARTRNYDGILSAATYATSTVPKFQAEGQYAVTARDATWAAAYQILAEVQAGTRPMPSRPSDIFPELPVLAWPV